MNMLKRLTDRIWIYPFEEERDRPTLGYIRGDRWSLAVDAGHSADHTVAFYKALEDAELPLPSLTALTHWHWDHTFGMHAVNGLCIANALTNDHLKSIRDWIEQKGREAFLALDEKIAREYSGNKPVSIILADLVFSGEIMLNAGSCPICLFQSYSPHTDDSTLVYIPDEKVLFPGDAAYGSFPTWKFDPVLSQKLIDTIAPLKFEICVKSHQEVCKKEEVLFSLKEELRNSETF